MPVTRTTLLGGPASATFGGRTFFAQDGILITPALDLEAVDSDAQGVLDATATFSKPMTIQFAPNAAFADLLTLYPFLAGEPGASLFGGVDSPLVLVASNGVRLTFAAVAIAQMPDLTLTTRGVVAGAVTFVALGARTLPITAANRLVTIDTAAVPVPSTVPPQLSDDFIITWGGMPWAKLRAMDGVAIKFEMKTSPVLSAANAVVDLTLDSLAVTASFVPATPDGPAEADVFAALQVQGARPGRLLSQGAATLEIAGEHLFVQIPQAQLTRGPLRFDATHPRVGELVFKTTRVALSAESVLEGLVGLSEGEPS